MSDLRKRLHEVTARKSVLLCESVSRLPSGTPPQCDKHVAPIARAALTWLLGRAQALQGIHGGCPALTMVLYDMVGF